MTEKQFKSWLKIKLGNFAYAVERGRVSARGSSKYGVKVLLDRLAWLNVEAKQRAKTIRKSK